MPVVIALRVRIFVPPSVNGWVRHPKRRMSTSKEKDKLLTDPLSMYTSMCTYLHPNIHIYLPTSLSPSLSLSLYIYIYIYI